MRDYKAMYYHITGRMEAAVEVLEATVEMLKSLEVSRLALVELVEKIKHAQKNSENMFVDSGRENYDFKQSE